MPGITGIPRLLAATVILIAVPVARAQVDNSRLQRTSPNLMLETGARTGMCDVLSFSRDGSELFAAGDDKVVRVFRVGANQPALSTARVLRWPIQRDQKGAIFAMDRSPDLGSKLVAIAGHGFLGDSVGVVDGGTGQLKHYLPSAGTSREIWSLAFTRDGRQLALGTGRGEVLLWDRQRGTDERSIRQLIAAPPDAENKVRLLRMLSDRALLSVTQDGTIQRTNMDDGKSERLGQFGLRSIYRVAYSPERSMLAATGEVITGDSAPDARYTIRLFSIDKRTEKYIRLPNPNEIPTAVGFSTNGQWLAIGTMIRGATASQADRPGGPFHAVAGGRIHIYDLERSEFARQPIDNGYMVEALAWHPNLPGTIASAGGPNHEVRLWNYLQPAVLVAEVRSPGSCLWGVRWSSDGKQIAFQDQLNRDPVHPNQRGAGSWRVFDLAAQEFKPAGIAFTAAQPVERYQGWHVRITLNPYVWEVVDPSGQAYPLDAKSGRYNPAMHNLPLCYSFIRPAEPGRPPRLALGHDFGVSIYDLYADGPRLSRVMNGHEGAVMSLAPSPDGRALVTASRDQTLAGWSLTDWPSQAELGASVEPTPDGKLRVANVDLGGPAWETGLLPNDTIVMVLLANRLGTGVNETTWLFDCDGQTASKHGLLNLKHSKRKSVTEMAEYLRQAEPAREIVIAFERDGKPEPLRKTSVRQVPLWKLFPTSNGEWLAWRWRDYFYNTNAPQADELAGWQVHSAHNPAATPVFYRLSQFPQQFRPDKVKEAFANFATRPEAVMLADIEPPQVTVQLTQAPGRDRGAVVTVSAEPRSPPQNAADFQNLERIELYVNEYKLAVLPLGPNGALQNHAAPIDKDLFRRGNNVVRVRAWNRGGAHADEVARCDYAFGPERGRLLGLCIGVADYRATAGGRRDFDLYKADVRARELAEALRRQIHSGLYTEVIVAEPLQNDRATPAAILADIRRFTGELKAGPNDTLVLFIASHGVTDADKGGAFAFQLGQNSKLYGADLRIALEKMPCRRLLLLDACYSGRINHNNEMIRTVTGNIPQLAFAACGPDEAAIYDDEGGGVFTNCLLRYLNAGPEGGPAIRSSDLVRMLSRDVPREAESIMEGHLAQFPNGGRQMPLFYHQPIAGDADIPLFGRNRP